MKILLIRLRLIGDVVFTTPLVGALRQHYPGAHLAYLVERAAAPVLAGLPDLDELIVVDRPRGLARIAADLRLAARLRAARFDLVLDLHGGPRSSWLARATGAPRRLGYDVQGRSWLYTHVVDRPRELRPRHSVLNQWDLLQALDDWPARPPDPVSDPVRMAPDPAAEVRIAERLRRHGVDDTHELVVVHVSAGNPFRRWPEPFFIEVVSTLAAAAPHRRVILSSGPSDRAAADRILAASRGALGRDRAARIVDFGDFDLPELRALVARSALFIGGDTGPLHIAATTSAPVVGIYGPTLSVRSAPWRPPGVPTISMELANLPCRPCDQRVCLTGDYRCLTALLPAPVIAAAEQALRRTA